MCTGFAVAVTAQFGFLEGDDVTVTAAAAIGIHEELFRANVVTFGLYSSQHDFSIISTTTRRMGETDCSVAVIDVHIASLQLLLPNLPLSFLLLILRNPRILCFLFHLPLLPLSLRSLNRTHKRPDFLFHLSNAPLCILHLLAKIPLCTLRVFLALSCLLRQLLHFL